MDLQVYEIEAQVEASHWWFSGRRALFVKEIERAGEPRSLLDIGTGSGSNLRAFKELNLPEVVGLDSNADVIEICCRSGLTVELGDILSIPFPDERFDAVIATDVIEHVPDDGKALSELFRVLRHGGFAVITVPAFQTLWGLQDVVARHYRRYRLRSLRRLILSAGFEIERAYYFNYLLFGPIWLARQVIRTLNINLESENQVNSPWINAILSRVFSLDIATAGFLHAPFGVSALVVARKPLMTRST